MTAEDGYRTYIGVDPGPQPGMARLVYCAGVLMRVDVAQCSPGAVSAVIAALLAQLPGPAVVQVESLVTGSRTGRVRNQGDLGATRQVISAVTGTLREHNVPAVTNARAVDAKRWATDERLAAAGLLEPTKGMRHARDAARHALYLACKSGMPDPLSGRK